MTRITTRLAKGRALTYAELDGNFDNLNRDKVERTDLSASGGAASVGHVSQGSDAVATTVQAVLREIVNFTRSTFHDPNADYSAVIQAGINAAQKTIVIPDVGFPIIVTGLTLNGKRLTGDATLLWKAGAGSAMLDIQGESIVKGLTLDGNGANQVGNVVAITFSNAAESSVRKNKFKNFRYKVLQTDVLLSSGVNIERNKFKNCGTVTGCDVVSLRSPYCAVNDNRFDTIGDGHCVRIGLYNGDATTNPVSGTMVRGNYFKDTQHVGVTCEIYTQGALITKNNFNNLEQAVKCETAASVFDIDIIDNQIWNITSVTALNLSADRVTFSGNRCVNVAGGPYFGNDYVCSSNTFIDCGTAGNVLISANGSLRGSVTDNIIKNVPYRAILVSGDATVTGNRIFTCGDAAIRSEGTGNILAGNLVDGAVTGLFCVSTMTSGAVTGNTLRNCTTPLVASSANFGVTFADNNGAGHPNITYTIASDAITVGPANPICIVDTEAAAAADDLSTINGGFIGQVIYLRSSVNARDVTVKNGVGNVRLSGADFVLNNARDMLPLVFTGVDWQEVSRSDNGV